MERSIIIFYVLEADGKALKLSRNQSLTLFALVNRSFFNKKHFILCIISTYCFIQYLLILFYFAKKIDATFFLCIELCRSVCSGIRTHLGYCKGPPTLAGKHSSQLESDIGAPWSVVLLYFMS